MKSRLLYTLLVVLVFNLSLVAVSAFLSQRSTQQYPMLGQLVDAYGVQLHVTDSGPVNSDTVVVLVHGASTSLLDFETSLKPALQDAYRIITIDRPGHGYSERGDSEELAHLRSNHLTQSSTTTHKATLDNPSQWIDPDLQARLIAEVLTTLDVNESIWVGHSWAGSVVLAGLLDETLNISAGVLIAGATHPWTGSNSTPNTMAARPLIGRLFSWQFIEPIGRFAIDDAVAEVFAPEAVPEHYVSDTGLVLSLRPETFRHNAIDRTQLSDFLVDQSTRYPTIDNPLLSITGSGDTVVPAWNHNDRLALQVPQLQSIMLEGAGHAPHHTRTKQVAEMINTFVESIQ